MLQPTLLVESWVQRVYVLEAVGAYCQSVLQERYALQAGEGRPKLLPFFSIFLFSWFSDLIL